MDEPIRSSAIAKVADRARAATDHVAEKTTGAVTVARNSVGDSVDSVAKRADAGSQWTPERVDDVKRGPDRYWTSARSTYGRAHTPPSG